VELFHRDRAARATGLALPRLDRAGVVAIAPALAGADRHGSPTLFAEAEARQMPGDLRIGWAIVGDGRRDGLRLSEPIDLHHPRYDRAVRRLPDQHAGQACR